MNHDLLGEQLFVTLSTDTAHIVDEDGQTACERFEFDLDRVRRTDIGRVVYEQQYFGRYGLIHEDDEWTPGNKSLCHYCDRNVADELQAELFTDDKFELVEGLTVEGDGRERGGR